MSDTVKDVLIRAGKTAAQTFVGTVSVQAAMAGDVAVIRAGAFAAAAAGLSVIWNAVLAYKRS